ncbi:unnamed protein product [Boreogadus saida]
MSKTLPETGAVARGAPVAPPAGLQEVFPGSVGERRDKYSGCNLSLGWLLGQDSQENKIVARLSLSLSEVLSHWRCLLMSLWVGFTLPLGVPPAPQIVMKAPCRYWRLGDHASGLSDEVTRRLRWNLA